MPNVPEPVRLIGNPEENFYILGKKHQAAFNSLSERITPAPSLKERIETLKNWRRPELVTLPDNTWGRWLKAYCEGLEVSPARYLNFLERLEQGALPGVLPGCTSVFRWDESGQTAQHLRLLDWPLALSTSENAELILVEAPHQTALLLVCLPGLAFLPLTALSAHGVTMALHAKYHTLQHAEGRPISEALIEGLLHSRSVTELRRHLKSFQTKRLWGLHCCDASGAVLAMDIGGPQVDVISAELRETQLLVFNNAPLARAKDTDHSEPPTFAHFCRARREWAMERLARKSDEHPLISLTRANKLQRSSVPAVTLSTTQAMAFNPATRSLDWLLGEAPLWQQGKMVSWQDVFHTGMRNPKITEVSFPKDERGEWNIRHHYAEAQKQRDAGDITQAFHHLQMGLAQAEGEARSLGGWVWAWWQWKHLASRRDRLMLYNEMEDVLRKTSRPYQGHVLLLRMLLELELGLVATVTPIDLPEELRRWSERFLTSPQNMRSALESQVDARLDIQDLTLPWTDAVQGR